MLVKRRHVRHPVYYPVQIETEAKKDRIGVVRNTSASGMLFGTPSRFMAGQRVVLRFKVLEEQATTEVTARVVRVGVDSEDGWFSRTVAVQFDRELEGIDEVLEAARPSQAHLHS